MRRSLLKMLGFAGPVLAISLVATAVSSPATALPAGTSASPSTAQITVKEFTSVLRVDGKVLTMHAGSEPGGRYVTPETSYPSSGYHAFTPQAPGWTFGDTNGHGSEQINYNSSSGTGLSEQWGYKLSAAAQSTVNGSVSENASLYCGSTPVTGYGSHTEPPNYQFHGSKGNLTNTCNYHTAFIAAWYTKSGGRATLNAQWNWVITFV